MAGLRDVEFKGFRQVVPDGQYEIVKADVDEFNSHAYVARVSSLKERSYLIKVQIK